MPEKNEAMALLKFLHDAGGYLRRPDPRSKVPLQDSATARERAKKALEVARKSGVLSLTVRLARISPAALPYSLPAMSRRHCDRFS